MTNVQKYLWITFIISCTVAFELQLEKLSMKIIAPDEVLKGKDQDCKSSKSPEVLKPTESPDNLNSSERTESTKSNEGTTNLTSSEMPEDLKPTEIPIDETPKDCTDIHNEGNSKSGVYKIRPISSKINKSIDVYCDMKTDGGGWTVIQRRGSYGKPKDYFYKTWKEYQTGFGNVIEDFWIGNDNLCALTKQGNNFLRVEIMDKNGVRKFSNYQDFRVDCEEELYRLNLKWHSGNAGDSLFVNNGMKFSTKDMDNDESDHFHCAQKFKGGWWFKGCTYGYLNGYYEVGANLVIDLGIRWPTLNAHYSFAAADMKIRRM